MALLVDVGVYREVLNQHDGQALSSALILNDHFMGGMIVMFMRWGDVVMARSYLKLFSRPLQKTGMPAVPALDCDECRWVQQGKACASMRCCTVTPPIPNFLVGELFAHEHHPVVEHWILQRRGDPFGISVPPVIRAEHEVAREKSFGKPCPLVDPSSGHCTIYQTRPAICMGFHCLYPDPLWQEAWGCFHMVLETWQVAATEYLVSTSSLSMSELASASSSSSRVGGGWEGQSLQPELYSRFWQEWEGREIEFYVDCYQRLTSLSSEAHEEIRMIQRLSVLERLEGAGILSDGRLEALELERCEDLCAKTPSRALRDQYATGHFFYPDDTCTLLEHEAHLMWYLEQLGESARA